MDQGIVAVHVGTVQHWRLVRAHSKEIGDYIKDLIDLNYQIENLNKRKQPANSPYICRQIYDRRRGVSVSWLPLSVNENFIKYDLLLANFLMTLDFLSFLINDFSAGYVKIFLS